MKDLKQHSNLKYNEINNLLKHIPKLKNKLSYHEKVLYAEYFVLDFYIQNIDDLEQIRYNIKENKETLKSGCNLNTFMDIMKLNRFINKSDKLLCGFCIDITVLNHSKNILEKLEGLDFINNYCYNNEINNEINFKHFSFNDDLVFLKTRNKFELNNDLINFLENKLKEYSYYFKSNNTCDGIYFDFVLNNKKEIKREETSVIIKNNNVVLFWRNCDV